MIRINSLIFTSFRIIDNASPDITIINNDNFHSKAEWFFNKYPIIKSEITIKHMLMINLKLSLNWNTLYTSTNCKIAVILCVAKLAYADPTE